MNPVASSVVLAVVSVLVCGLGVAYAEIEIVEYETIPYGEYVIHFEYEGDGTFEMFLEDREITQGYFLEIYLSFQ